MIIIRLRFTVTNRAAENGIIARRRMAVGTFIPFAFMLAAVYGEMHRVMVES